MTCVLDLEYVLPLRWDDETSARESPELASYLGWLCTVADVTVVDGSEEAVFRAHGQWWGSTVRHVRPVGQGLNGKVPGVVTGVLGSRHEAVVIADDDVRYDVEGLMRVRDLLRSCDVVRPQCYFEDTDWHAHWDTGRTLLNRALGHDHPGTYGVRRSAFVRAGGYDADTLFENLEMVRTVVATGAEVRDAPGVYVRRKAPTTRHFWHQRIRQAYDDFAQPARLLAELALLPALLATMARRPRLLLAEVLAVVALAERGRRKAGGAAVFRPWAACWAPAWMVERSGCVWLAVAARVRGGVRYGDRRVPVAAHSLRTLRRRHEANCGDAL